MKKLIFLLLPISVAAQNQATTQLNINLTEIYSISVDNNATEFDSAFNCLAKRISSKSDN